MIPWIGVNTKSEVQKTLGSPKPLVSVLQDTAGDTVVRVTAHGFGNGDVVVFNVTEGMPLLDRQATRVANVSTDTFEAENLDITDWDALVSGTVTKVSAYETFEAVQSASAPNAEPAEIDVSTMLDQRGKIEYGRPAPVKGQFNCLYNPLGSAEALIRTATLRNADIVVRITDRRGRQIITNATVSGGQGFDWQQNDAAKATASFTPQGGIGMIAYEPLS